MKKNTLCGIVGDGRMAGHFCNYLRLSKIPFNQWSRKKNSDIHPEEFLKDCRVVLLLIKDDAILPFTEQYPEIKQLNLVHFSGSLYIEDIPSIHPLMTFSKDLYSLEKYQSIPFIHEKGKISFKDLFPQLPNPSKALDFREKSLYHSLCVLSGNFTTMLWQKVFTDFQGKLDLNADLLLPYMQQTFENLKTNWVDALTGPLARKDSVTIEKNLKALDGDPYREVYRSFAETVLNRKVV